MDRHPAEWSLFGDLQWLSAFHSDGARLAAIGLVSVALVMIFALPSLARVWAQDRKDRRAHERRTTALTAAIDDVLARRKQGRLDLDD